MMSKLHSNAKAHSLDETKRILRQAFGGRKLEDIFEEFDKAPLGVGAIAQVYKAKVKPDLLPPERKEDKNFKQNLLYKVEGLVKSSPGQGPPSTYVAIKVIHPRVDKIVNRDLRIMRFFAVLLNAIPTLEWLSFPDEVSTFSDMMRLQMDLRIEAENLARFRLNFKHRSTVTFPIPYREYTTRDILIEEFVDGVPLSAFLESGGGVYQEGMANMGLDAFLVPFPRLPSAYALLNLCSTCWLWTILSTRTCTRATS
jgi:aarF domain-containing kinase